MTVVLYETFTTSNVRSLLKCTVAIWDLFLNILLNGVKKKTKTYTIQFKMNTVVICLFKKIVLSKYVKDLIVFLRDNAKNEVQKKSLHISNTENPLSLL